MAVHHSAAPEVKRIAEKLIRRDPEFRHLLNVRIEYVFRSEASRSNGKLTLGKARKVTGLNALLATPDIADDPDATSEDAAFFVLEVAADTWLLMNDTQREALTYHELCHFGIYVDDEGAASLSIIPHDVEAFGAEIHKYGPWKMDLYEFFEMAGANDVLTMWEQPGIGPARLSVVPGEGEGLDEPAF